MKSLCIAVIFLAASAASAQAPSLADVARLNRAARQSKKAETLVIDEDAMIVSGSVTKPVPAGTGVQESARDLPQSPVFAGQEAQKPVPLAKVSASPTEDECARLKKEIEELKAQEQGWKHSAAAYEEKLAGETSEFRRTMYQDALENDRRNIFFYQRKIGDAEAKLAEAEAAKSGASAAGGALPQ